MSKPVRQQIPTSIHNALRHVFDKLNAAKRSATLAFSATDPNIKTRHELEQVHALLSTELSLRSLQQVLYGELGETTGDDNNG